MAIVVGVLSSVVGMLLILFAGRQRVGHIDGKIASFGVGKTLVSFVVCLLIELVPAAQFN
jgi:hypothetical protein